jgi:alpha-D-xyloside xylohydrolase
VVAGQTQRDVAFPGGVWFDWFDGTIYDGGSTITVPAPLSKLPLFLRAGGIVPLLRPSIDTLSPTTMPNMVDSFDSTPGILYARVAPGPASSFQVYDGTQIGQAEDDGAITLEWTEGTVFVQGGIIELVGIASPPSSVTLDGMAVPAIAPSTLEDSTGGWAHTTEVGGTLSIRIPAGDHQIVVTPGG